MAEGLVLPYLDIPFQHASRSVLKAMRRPANEAKVLERIKGWREICPDIAVRSTFVVGFPGETEDDFRYLMDRSEEHTSELQSLMRISYAVFCLKKKMTIDV